MSLLRKKQKTRATRPNEAVIPPSLTEEEAEISWEMALRGMFKTAGMDKYLESQKVEGGFIRPAIRDEGGLCDYPACPKEYEYALELDVFGDKIQAGVVVDPAKAVYVCEDHKDYRPTELLPHRFTENYVWNRSGTQERGVSKIPSIQRIEEAKS